MAEGQWWAVALTEAVSSEKPLPVVCEGEELVLFRNAAGQAFALEDRCPHRRVPLSPGVLTPGGLQCPYHGWTFDGASGVCREIPNLHADERVPARHAAKAFLVAEADGFIHVWRGSGAPTGVLPSAAYRPAGREYSGSAVVNMAHCNYLETMLDGPECLLAFPCVTITDFFLGEPRRDDKHLVLDHGGVWKGKGIGPAFVRDHPLVLRTRVPLVGGAIFVELLTAAEVPLVTIFIASTANRRGTTSLNWRGFRHAHKIPSAPLAWQLRRAAGRAPFEVLAEVKGASIAALRVAPSLNLTSRTRHEAECRNPR
ncbi:Rieske 2Fe-2S domain-containing protein [Zoogloea sp. LCSB751]|uniref:Rieske 2Fe-2S domain-containing protein n=1 Tax=Zoogloea sp. LCSB751 TaxID=1965277 RepID=UPI0009A4C01A|nr:Rieske 2Fe-2S domain-containing protein [Zoogloea sp. LCSB751]